LFINCHTNQYICTHHQDLCEKVFLWYCELILVLDLEIFIITGKQAGFCMMCELQRHVKRCYENYGNAIKPQSILQKLRSRFIKYMQMQKNFVLMAIYVVKIIVGSHRANPLARSPWQVNLDLDK
jgi:hypothetical protein